MICSVLTCSNTATDRIWLRFWTPKTRLPGEVGVVVQSEVCVCIEHKLKLKSADYLQSLDAHQKEKMQRYFNEQELGPVDWSRTEAWAQALQSPDSRKEESVSILEDLEVTQAKHNN